MVAINPFNSGIGQMLSALFVGAWGGVLSPLWKRGVRWDFEARFACTHERKK